MSDVYDLPQMQLDLEAEERKLRILSYKLISAKEKLKRVDPVSQEFDETVELIENTRDEIHKRAHRRFALRDRINKISLFP